MDTDSTFQLVFIIILLALSAFFSSAETAFTTVNKIKIRSLIDEGNKRAVTVDKIIKNSGKMLSAILIGNNIVNISASSLSTTFAIKIWGNYAAGIVTGVLTLLVLIFGEITPKTAAKTYAEKFALVYAPIINFIMIVLTPVIIVVDFLASIFLSLFGLSTKEKNDAITEEELITFVKVSHEDGVIESDEKEIINNLFEFGDSVAKDIMIPRIDMTLADVNSTYNEIIEIYRQTKYSRIPVFEENVDNIIGILNIKDLILTPVNGDFDLRNVMREPYFIYEQKNTSDLFKEMQKLSQSIAIVLDEYGSTAGMITTEDLLEEIVGEIRDEYDIDEEEPFKRLFHNIYHVNASYKLDDLNEQLGINLESEDNDSLGGYITEKLDYIPVKGERFRFDNLEFIIQNASKSRIDSVIIKVHPSQK